MKKTVWVVYKENGGRRVTVAEFREKSDADEYVNVIGGVRYDENLSEWDYDYYGEVRE
jgi:rhodanese-related sulfurtransferase